MIGREYKYPNGKRIFTLTETNGYIYRFACGHWCTDNVFADLIDVKTGVQNYKSLGVQLTLF
jgi:hypothetical protein